jgi:Rrf2 family iron-sulfur cluster assembly transcriptional regulator
MSVIFSRQCEYALQAVLYLALQPEGKKCSIKELSKRLKLPYHFLAKILQQLSRKGLLTSLKGPTGGFGLAIPAEHITLFHIVEAIDGPSLFNNCVLGLPECGGKHPCPVHDRWGELREQIYAMLVRKSIAQLAGKGQRPEHRLKFLR